MIVVVAAIGTELAGLAPEHADELAANTAAYVAELEALDTEISAQITAIPHDDRHAITSHAMLGYFAARYDIHIEATIVGASSQAAEPRRVRRTVDLLMRRQRGDLREATERTDVADSLAAEAAGDVRSYIEVESLGRRLAHRYLRRHAAHSPPPWRPHQRLTFQRTGACTAARHTV